MFWLKKWLGSLIMPLPLSICLILLGLILLWATRRQTLGKLSVTVGVLMLGLFSLPSVSVQLLRPLEQQYLFLPASTQVDYILVLGAGQVTDPTVPLTSQPGNAATARVLAALDLKRHNPKAKLVFSGNTHEDPVSCAEIYARLAEYYGVSRQDMVLIEDAYDTEGEIAHYGAFIGAHKAALVTSASHMPRAMQMAKQAGLQLIPFPTDYRGRLNQTAQPLYASLPSGQFLLNSDIAMHEWIGQLWQRLRGQNKD